MFKYGKRSRNNLRECHEDLQKIFNKVINYIDCSVIEGSRDEIEQNKLFHAGKSQLKFPNSKHNVSPEQPLSMAADVVPYINNEIPWHDTDYFYYFGGFVLAVADLLFENGEISHQIKWGGDWKCDNDLHNQSFFDYPHFEIIL